MPVTPLHIGIPGIPSFIRPDRVDISAAILGSTLVDIDFFLHILTGSDIHGRLHSYPGATLLALLLIVVIWKGDPLFIKIKGWFRWETETNLRAITLGAFLGTYSHVLLDSFIYWDLNPWSPFGEDNPFYWHDHHDLMTSLVYMIASLTTISLLVLWVRQFGKAQK
jgi:hypothetical protein